MACFKATQALNFFISFLGLFLVQNFVKMSLLHPAFLRGECSLKEGFEILDENGDKIYLDVVEECWRNKSNFSHPAVAKYFWKSFFMF